MPLTTEEQAARLRELASDDMVAATARLAGDTRRWMFWPFSRARLAAVMAALHDLMHVQTNRLMSTVGAMVRTYDARVAELERRVSALEAWRERGGDEP